MDPLDRKREFLVDLCAFADEQMVLALESEWNPNPISTFEDFRKLLQLKAPLKVMICDSPVFVRTRLSSVAAFLARYPEHRLGEEYIIFNFRGNRTVLNCHRWKPKKDGIVHPDEIRFALVAGFPRKLNEEIPDGDDGSLGEIS